MTSRCRESGRPSLSGSRVDYPVARHRKLNCIDSRKSCRLPSGAERRRVMRMPPSAPDNNRGGYDALVADHMLVDHIDIVELAVLNRQDGRVANAGRFQTAEFGPLESHGGIHGGCGDKVAQRHSETEELREGGHLVE